MTVYFDYTKEEYEMYILEAKLKLLRSLEYLSSAGVILIIVIIIRMLFNKM